MAKKKYGDDGLPMTEPKNTSGNLTIRLDNETWEMLADLHSKWAAEKKIRLSLTDSVTAVIRRQHRVEFVPVKGEAETPALTPLEEYEKAQERRELMQLRPDDRSDSDVAALEEIANANAILDGATKVVGTTKRKGPAATKKGIKGKG